jgi:hypothetical protein
MPDGGVSDAQIAAMSAAERRELIRRLERPLDELLPEPELARVRRVRLVLMTGALRILRLTATRLYLLDPGMPLWRIPLLP